MRRHRKLGILIWQVRTMPTYYLLATPARLASAGSAVDATCCAEPEREREREKGRENPSRSESRLLSSQATSSPSSTPGPPELRRGA